MKLHAYPYDDLSPDSEWFVTDDCGRTIWSGRADDADEAIEEAQLALSEPIRHER